MSEHRGSHETAATSLPDAGLRAASGNAFEHAVEQLARAIRLGVLPDGEQLPPERELAERLGIGRNTLRDAIAALRESGLVTTRRGRGGGTWVTYDGSVRAATWEAKDSPVRSGAAMLDALTFRRVVEPGAAWLAASARRARPPPARRGARPPARRAGPPPPAPPGTSTRPSTPRPTGSRTRGCTWRSRRCRARRCSSTP